MEADHNVLKQRVKTVRNQPSESISEKIEHSYQLGMLYLTLGENGHTRQLADSIEILAESLINSNSEREFSILASALRWLSSLGYASFPEIVYRAPAHILQGEIHEELGNGDEAIRHYQQMIDLWSNGDPEIQVLVEDLRGRIRRLGGEPA